MANILKKIFGDGNQRQLNRIQKTVDEIEALEPTFENISDTELKNKTEEFKERYQNGETLDDLLPEAYAAVRRHQTGAEYASFSCPINQGNGLA